MKLRPPRRMLMSDWLILPRIPHTFGFCSFSLVKSVDVSLVCIALPEDGSLINFVTNANQNAKFFIYV